MVKVAQAQRHIKDQLKQHGITSASFEANCLLEHITGQNKQWLLLGGQNYITEEQSVKLDNLVKRRIQGQPLQYLLGSWEFYGLEFAVGDGVLIPRPDSEILCEFAISQLQNKRARVADLCAGTGCLGIAVQKSCPDVSMTCVECSPKAIGYLKQNIKAHGNLVKQLNADVLDPNTVKLAGALDAIICNPPYLDKKDMENLQTEVTYEPAMALYGHEDGLHFYREITLLWKESLLPGGWIAYEIGAGQEQMVCEILEQHGFSSIGTKRDYNNIHRVVYGVK